MVELFIRNKWRACAYIAVLAAFLLGAVFHSNIISFGAFAIGCCVVLVQKWNPFPFLFLLFPYANIIKLGVGSSSLFTYLCMFVLIWWFLRRMTIKGSFLALLIFFFAYLLWGDGNGLLASVKLVINIALVYCYATDMSEETICESVDLLADGLILSLMLSNIDWFYNRIIGYMRVVYFNTGTDITRSCGLFDDPNYCTLAITMTVAVMLVLYYRKKTTVLFWPRCVLLIAFGMLTYSKSFFLVTIAIVTYAVLMVIPKRNIKAVLVVAVALSIFIGLALDGRIEAVNRIIDRFERLDLTSGRADSSDIYISYLGENVRALLLGDGITKTIISTYDHSVHNLYIESIQRIGLLGSTLLLFTIMSSMPHKMYSKTLIGFFPLLCMLVQYMALAGLTSYALPFYIMLSYSSMVIAGTNLRNSKIT